MRYVKKYAEGGKLPSEKLGNLMHALKYYSNPKGEQYDTSTLLDMLSFTKGPKDPNAPMDWSIKSKHPEFSSFRKGKKGDVRIAEYDEEKEGYNPDVAPMSLEDPQLDKLAGRPLKPSEQSRFKELLNDPSMLKYFMDMMEEGDMDFRKAKMGKVKSTKKEPSGGSGGGWKKVCKEGEGCKLVRSGQSHSAQS